MLVLSRYSDDSRVQYVSVNPLDAVLQRSMSLQRFVVAGLFVIMILGVCLSYLLSKRYTRSVSDIIGMIGRRLSLREKSITHFNVIREYITDLTTQNITLLDTMDQQIILSRSLFFGHLLSGMIRDQQELDQYIKYFHLEAHSAYYAVLCVSHQDELARTSIEVEDIFERDLLKLHIDKTLQTIPISSAFSFLLDNSDVAIIACLDERGDETIEEQTIRLARVLHDSLKQTQGIRAFIGIGNPYPRMLDMHTSYTEARDALGISQSAPENPISQYSMLNMRPGIGYYYPMDMEQRIISFTKAGKKQALFGVIEQVIHENFTNRVLEKGNRLQLYGEIHATLTKTVNDISGIIPDAEKDRYIQHKDFSKLPEDEILQNIRQGFSSLCEMVDRRKKSHNQALINKILEEIRARFNDPNMGADTLAYQFMISPTYFSRYFKEQTGEGFNVYLERMRIDKAQELILGTNWPMERIANEVGYNSVYSFRRAFKKSTGFVPSEYRNNR